MERDRCTSVTRGTLKEIRGRRLRKLVLPVRMFERKERLYTCMWSARL